MEVSEDNEDGTYPRVSDYIRFVNSLERDGTSYFLNSLTRKRNKLNIDCFGVNIRRTMDYKTEAIITFPEPIDVVFGYIGEEAIIKQVSEIKGEFVHDWFWRKNGRQNKVANGFEIWFSITKYIK